MSRLTRDGTAEPVSGDQILRHARGQGNVIFPVQLTTSRIDNLTRLIHTLLYVMTIHTCIHTYIACVKMYVKAFYVSDEQLSYFANKPTIVVYIVETCYRCQVWQILVEVCLIHSICILIDFD